MKLVILLFVIVIITTSIQANDSHEHGKSHGKKQREKNRFKGHHVIDYKGRGKIEMLNCAENVMKEYQEKYPEASEYFQTLKVTFKHNYHEQNRCKDLLDSVEINECADNIRSKFADDINTLEDRLEELDIITTETDIVSELKEKVENCVSKNT